MALFPSSLSSMGLSFVAKDEEVQIMVIPGSFGFVFGHGRTLDRGFSAMGKGDKIKARPFIELVTDTTACKLAVLTNYIQDTCLFTTDSAGHTFRSASNYKDRLLLAIHGVTISNLFAWHLRYSGLLLSENKYVMGPTAFGDISPDTQPGVGCDATQMNTFDQL